MTARIGHDIDGGRSAEHFAARCFNTATVEIGLGLCVIAPIMHPIFMHLAHAERDVDEWVEIAPACFDDENACAFIF